MTTATQTTKHNKKVPMTAKKLTAEDKINTKIRQIATEMLKDDGALTAAERAAVLAVFDDEHADVVLAVIEGQLALASTAALGDDTEDGGSGEGNAEDDEDEDSDEGDAEDDDDE